MATSSNETLFSSAYGVADSLLMMEARVTQEALERTVTVVLAMPDFAGNVDGMRLLKELEAKNNTHVDGYSVIDDNDFSAWVAGARETESFEFWKRYQRYLERKKTIAPKSSGAVRQSHRRYS